MRVAARAVVLGLAGLTAFGAAGCNRGGGSAGTTTIIQQAPSVNSGTIMPNSAASSANQTPINDAKKLCNFEMGRGQEVIDAIDGFWGLAIKDGWSWGDPKVVSAADNASQVVAKVTPALEAAVGVGTPPELAAKIKQFVNSSKDFSDAINNRDNDSLDALNKSFGAAVDSLKSACGK